MKHPDNSMLDRLESDVLLVGRRIGGGLSGRSHHQQCVGRTRNLETAPPDIYL
jgi:hypothetical protein